MIKNSDNEDIKKNLVEYLTDEETINKYLHPKNYSTFQLLKEAFKPIKSNNKLKILWVYQKGFYQYLVLLFSII